MTPEEFLKTAIAAIFAVNLFICWEEAWRPNYIALILTNATIMLLVLGVFYAWAQ